MTVAGKRVEGVKTTTTEKATMGNNKPHRDCSQCPMSNQCSTTKK